MLADTYASSFMGECDTVVSGKHVRHVLTTTAASGEAISKKNFHAKAQRKTARFLIILGIRADTN